MEAGVPLSAVALRALFFDFDGLILDTETPEVEVWREIFESHGLEFPLDYWLSIVGKGADQLVEKPLPMLQRLVGRPLDLDDLDANRYRRLMERIEAQPVLPGVLELADEARAEGLPVAVVSSSHHGWVDGHLTRLGILDRFDRTVCCDDVVWAKPYPDLYLKACEIFGVKTSEAVTLEDSANGIAAANAAGVFVVAVPNDVTRRLDLSNANTRADGLAGMTLSRLREIAGR